MHRLDNAATAQHALNAVRTAQGRPTQDRDELNGEEIADLIANLLHLAREAHLDPEETHARGWSYFDGDAEEEEHTRFAAGATGYHGTPALLTVGTVLTPGPHLHHVYAATTPDAALMWGKVRAGGEPVHVYRVRFGDDAEDAEGHLYGRAATVEELLHHPGACTEPDCRRLAGYATVVTLPPAATAADPF